MRAACGRSYAARMTTNAPTQRPLKARGLFLTASVVASLTYFLFRDMATQPETEILWKGAGVGCLAIYAARRARSTDGWLVVAVMALGAIADMVLETSMTAGGLVFALAHVAAVALYLRNPRPRRSGSQILAAATLLVGTPLVAALFTFPDPQWPLAAGYSLFVGAMAASAWVSRFPRYRVGLGAVLFVISDLLIFAREGQRLPEAVTGWLIWPLYYGGQFMIATGIARSQSGRKLTPG